MEVGDGQAESRRWLEASGRGVHADCWRLERIVGREHERAPVLAIMIGSIGRSDQYVVPSVIGRKRVD